MRLGGGGGGVEPGYEAGRVESGNETGESGVWE